jgi:alkylation response protein AidB-like acyl-CoA dehydrogenase
MALVNDHQRDEFRTELRSTVRSLLDHRGVVARVRDLVDDAAGFDALEAETNELGWPSIEIPEADGGLGEGFAAACVIVQELGRVLSPLPYFSSEVLGVGALLWAPEDLRQRWLPAIGSGETVATAALGDHAGIPGASSVFATQIGSGWRLDGEAGFVTDLPRADLVVVLARAQTEEPLLVLVPTDAAGVTVEPQPTVDATRQLGRLRLDGLSVAASEVIFSEGAAVERLVNRAAVAIAVDSVGGAERVLEMTVQYLKERKQFGRPVGSFQALKHRCVDMFLKLEAARGAAEHAALVIDDASQATIAASTAKQTAADAYAEIAAEAIQMHGGIGYTWEHDLHLYLKRAKLNQALVGDSTWHLARIAELLAATLGGQP